MLVRVHIAQRLRQVIGAANSPDTSESPLLVRELMDSMLGWFVGSIPASIVTFGTNYITSNLSWQIPLILQAVAA